MRLKIATQPTVEPVSLQEAKLHLRLNSGTFAEDITTTQSIAPGAHVVAAAYSKKGSGVDVSAGANIMVILEAATCGAGGSVDVKLQESNTDVDGDYVDVTGGAFAQVTEANDNATYEKAYTGTKKYIRAVATIAVATCSFAVTVVVDAPTHADDDLVTRHIKTARVEVENFLNRALITQTWDMYLEGFPGNGEILVPRPPLQSVTHVKYKDTAGVLQTWGTANYIVDTMSDDQQGRIALAYGISWPSTYAEIQAVQIRFVAGYGVAANVPDKFKDAILLKVADLYQNRGDRETSRRIDEAVEALLWYDRVVPI